MAVNTGFSAVHTFRDARSSPFDDVPLTLVQNIAQLSGFFGYSNDFFLWEGPNNPTTPPETEGGWQLTSVRTGGTPAIVRARGNVETGELRIQPANGIGDEEVAQMGGAPFSVAQDELWYFTRFRVRMDSGIGPAEIVIGLVNTNTSAPFSTIAEGIYLSKSNTSANYDLIINGPSASTTVSDFSVVGNAVIKVFGIKVEATGNINIYEGTTPNDLVVTQTILPTEPNIPVQRLAPIFAIRTGVAVSQSIDVDWLLCAQRS